MELVKDENGNIVDLSKILTMTDTIKTTGSNGSERWFESRHQYVFVDKSTRIPEDDLQEDYGMIAVEHFHLEIDDEDFYIPGLAACVEMMLRPFYRQDIRYQREWESNQPRNFEGELRDVAGIDLKKRASPQYNGYDLMEELDKEVQKQQGNKYGERQEDPETLRRDPV